MLRYEIATLTIYMGTTAKAAEAVKAYTDSGESKGTLLGCWFADIGQLNQLIIFRGFDSVDELEAEREAVRRSSNPFGCAEFMTDMSLESYAPFPFLPPVSPAEDGPIYEIRTYQLKQGGLEPTIAAWEKAVPKRSEFSPLTISMFAVDGSQRITHIWPYKSLEERTKARTESVKAGAWPPVGGPDWLELDMKSTVAVPTAVSPLK
ncbi:NIPSNAP family protein [Marinobacterium zhoushanense]|uniref:NIPSNAP family protein n=1 Tax=Marinobacterium zhoushanense TaxID=1679163 RepID=A0ABQ1KG89_9GAMM|nr:NIPSNAP family protein [Marinobacterium zhoushanense]GGB94880.1 NIPSNAP family protein [Marinobacterium zhoushanense]